MQNSARQKKGMTIAHIYEAINIMASAQHTLDRMRRTQKKPESAHERYLLWYCEISTGGGCARTKNEIIRQETLIRRANLRALLCELEIDVTWKRIFAKAIEYIAKWPPSNFVYHFFPLSLSLSVSSLLPFKPYPLLSLQFRSSHCQGGKWNLFLFTQSSLMHDTYTIWNRLVMRIASRTQVYMMCVCVCSYPQKRWHTHTLQRKKTNSENIVHVKKREEISEKLVLFLHLHAILFLLRRSIFFSRPCFYLRFVHFRFLTWYSLVGLC